MPESTLGYRISSGMLDEDALTSPYRGKERPITYNGKTQTMKEWAQELGMPITSLSNRLNRLGWSEERALSTPINSNLARSYKK